MRDVMWRMGLTLIAVALLTVLGPGVSCSTGNRLVERIIGQTPETRIAGYLDAITEGDRAVALALWPSMDPSNTDLEARRESVTAELLARGPRLQHRILDVVWWRTCCEPAVIDDPAEAGGARIRVTIRSESRQDEVYTFDLLVPGGYWGAAMGHPIRRWAIVDVYPEEAAPLARTWW
jgi:hypothetical protein